MAATPTVCEHLHYPLQSGSDRVLALRTTGSVSGDVSLRGAAAAQGMSSDPRGFVFDRSYLALKALAK